VRNATIHADFPAVGVYCPVVVPAERDTVVGVSRTTARMFANVMDFAPRRGQTASWDNATAVSDCNCSSLLRSEASLRRPELDNPSALVEAEVLNPSSACVLANSIKRDRVDDTLDVTDRRTANFPMSTYVMLDSLARASIRRSISLVHLIALVDSIGFV
jgi:hypothetical protein